MSRFASDLSRLLGPAVKAARAALNDLESEEVPASLRKVAATSGGRLPSPLVSSLLLVLDESEWLREKAVAKLPTAAESPAALAFLERSDGWWDTIADALADSRAAEAGAAAAKATATADKLSDRLEVAKDRARKAAGELDAERARARRKKPVTAPSTTRAAELKKAGSRIARLESNLANEVDDRVEAEAMIARLRARLRRASREHRGRSVDQGPGSSLGGDPIETARTLDLMAAVAPNRSEQPDPRGDTDVRAPTLELPAGLRPDDREAVDWLASVEVPITVIVDGYNVLFNIDPTATTGRARDMLAQHLARFRRGAGTARVVVVYDSDLPGDREPRTLPGGVEVHFADDDRQADDEVVDLAASARGSVTVITSDRRLRERSEIVGALTLWSEALADWIARRSG